MGNDAIVLLDERISPTSNGSNVTFSDTTDFMMTCPAAAQEYRDNKYCRGFHANAAGNLAVWRPESETSVTYNVVAGNYYPYSVRRFLSTGTDAGLKVAGKIIAER